LGGKTYWLGKLGTDWIGDRILDQLIQEGVDCSHVRRDSGYCSPFNLAAFAGDQRRRIGGFLLPNSLNELTNLDISDFTREMKPNAWVIVEIGEIDLAITLEFCLAVKACQANLLIDVDLDPRKQCRADSGLIREILSKADVIAPNVASMRSIFPDLPPTGLAETMATEFGSIIVITAGDDGSYYCFPGEVSHHKKAIPVKVIDPVGAGDAFHGGLLYGLASGAELESAIDLGLTCAAANCQTFGARTGMPFGRDLSLEQLFTSPQK